LPGSARPSNLHKYDKQPLDSRIERTDDSPRYWRRETVSFTAAYPNDRVLAHLFLPKNARPPYQVVVIMGGSTIMNALKRVEDFDYPYEFVIRSGRALVIPVFYGTLERGPTASRMPPNQQRDRALKFSMDLGRTIDYLETRSDLDVTRLGFYGISSGASNGIRMVAVEPRVKAAVLSSGGFFANDPPEINSWNFAPRVRIPILMVNGRDDFLFSLETNQKPLFRALAVGSCDRSAPAPSPSTALASPKSSTFTVPDDVTLILAGFRSRWMIPFSCALSSASASYRASASASGTGIAAVPSRSASVAPSTSSITSAWTPSLSSIP
jgi:dienelactone hydrolase